eukprot:Sspe_Gene.86052::Locus_56791_Transcript_1_1_Confidence_1.000_Length_2657::g.86052::m.86052/K17541/SCYL2; SCY1-like protein 2
MLKSLKGSIAKVKTGGEGGSDQPLTFKGFTLEGDGTRGCTASGGHQMLWRVYPAVRESTRESVSIFVVVKRDIEEAVGREKGAQVLEWLKNGVARQSRIIHPCIVKVIETFKEKPTYAYFVTEPVVASMANVLGDHARVDVVQERVRAFNAELTDVERAYGLFQLAEGLAFIHNQVGIAHLNLTPGNVWISRRCDWKLGGFDFSIAPGGGAEPNKNFRLAGGGEMFDTSINPFLGPSLEYAAPEYVNECNPGMRSDLFSLGCLIYDVMSFKGRGESRPDRKKLIPAPRDVASHRSHVERLCRGNVGALQDECGAAAAQTIRALISDTRGGGRVENVMRGNELFTELPVRCLIYLPKLPEKDLSAKLPFFKDLYGIVGKYSPRTLLAKVVPPLLGEVGNESSVRYVLPILLNALPTLSSADFETHILPTLAPFFKNGNVQVSAILLEKIEEITAKCSPQQVQSLIAPFINRQLQTNVSEALFVVTKNLCLKGLIKDAELQGVVIPRFVAVVLRHPNAKLRHTALVSLEPLLGLCPTAATTSIIEPALRATLTNDTDSAVLSTAVTMYAKCAAPWPAPHIAQTIQVLLPLMGGAADNARLKAFNEVLQSLLKLMFDKCYQRLNPPQQPAAPPPKQAAAPPPEPAAVKDWQDDLPLNVNDPKLPESITGSSNGWESAWSSLAAATPMPAANPAPDAFGDFADILEKAKEFGKTASKPAPKLTPVHSDPFGGTKVSSTVPPPPVGAFKPSQPPSHQMGSTSSPPQVPSNPFLDAPKQQETLGWGFSTSTTHDDEWDAFAAQRTTSRTTQPTSAPTNSPPAASKPPSSSGFDDFFS